MNLLRKLAWSGLLLACGLTGASGAREEASGTAPPASPPDLRDWQPVWPSFVDEDDEFEGEGWTFWPLSGKR